MKKRTAPVPPPISDEDLHALLRDLDANTKRITEKFGLQIPTDEPEQEQPGPEQQQKEVKIWGM
ncbi:MAG: hypothetical protein NTNFB02_01550 [Nitrospira sp.]